MDACIVCIYINMYIYICSRDGKSPPPNGHPPLWCGWPGWVAGRKQQQPIHRKQLIHRIQPIRHHLLLPPVMWVDGLPVGGLGTAVIFPSGPKGGPQGPKGSPQAPKGGHKGQREA